MSRMQADAPRNISSAQAVTNGVQFDVEAFNGQLASIRSIARIPHSATKDGWFIVTERVPYATPRAGVATILASSEATRGITQSAVARLRAYSDARGWAIDWRVDSARVVGYVAEKDFEAVSEGTFDLYETLFAELGADAFRELLIEFAVADESQSNAV